MGKNGSNHISGDRSVIMLLNYRREDSPKKVYLSRFELYFVPLKVLEDIREALVLRVRQDVGAIPHVGTVLTESVEVISFFSDIADGERGEIIG
ncbi:MAG: hypothetical protein O0X96_05565 [Methanocorpusculum sp.]|nr:hypothetical protein [Methanocorpusculum sp.]